MHKYTSEKEILEALERQVFLVEKYLDKEIYTVGEVGQLISECSVGLYNTSDMTANYLNKQGENMLGMSLEEFKLNPMQFVNEMVYPGDFEKAVRLTKDFVLGNSTHSSINFIQRVYSHKNKDYKAFYTVTRSLTTSDHLVSIVIHIKAINTVTNKIVRSLEEAMYFRKHYRGFKSLTNRGKEIITLLALGYQNNEIAEQLFISKATVEQHHKNLKRKLEIKRFVDLICFAQAFDLI